MATIKARRQANGMIRYTAITRKRVGTTIVHRHARTFRLRSRRRPGRSSSEPRRLLATESERRTRQEVRRRASAGLLVGQPERLGRDPLPVLELRRRVEVKASASVGTSDVAGPRKLAGASGSKFAMGIVLCDTDAILPFGSRLCVAPVSTLF
jgi:hypothetical protein